MREFMQPDHDCIVDFVPSYTAALYATTKERLCDAAYVCFTITAQRAFCGEDEVGSMPACPPYNDSITFR